MRRRRGRAPHARPSGSPRRSALRRACQRRAARGARPCSDGTCARKWPPLTQVRAHHRHAFALDLLPLLQAAGTVLAGEGYSRPLWALQLDR